MITASPAVTARSKVTALSQVTAHPGVITTMANPPPLTLSPVVTAFLTGSFSATCSTLLLQPLDLIKTRIQQTPGRRLSLFAAGRQVVAADRITGLWRGMTPSLLRTVPGVGFYFATMHGLKTTFCGGVAPTALQSLAIGCTARMMAGLLTIPVTVVKIRLESGLYQYRGTVHALYSVSRTEGLRGLTAGLLPTLVRDVPFSGLYLMFYEGLKKALVAAAGPRLSTDAGTPPAAAATPPVVASGLLQFGCGLVAGVLASLVTQPADVVKTRLQLTQGRAAGGVWEVTAAILQQEGPRGLLVGSTPRILRRTIMAALAWAIYERAMRLAGIK